MVKWAAGRQRTMNHHGSPEHRQWRTSVFEMYGRRCLLCRHAGNLHAHHLLPVADFPALAFSIENGAPLCGNCHAKVRGRESEYVDELRQRQAAVLAGQKPTNLRWPKHVARRKPPRAPGAKKVAAKASKTKPKKAANSIGAKEVASLAVVAGTAGLAIAGWPLTAAGTFLAGCYAIGRNGKKKKARTRRR